VVAFWLARRDMNQPVSELRHGIVA
jgi:hypothetical protein